MSVITNSQGLKIPPHQYTDIPDGLRHETLIIPSTSVPTWGGYFIFDFKDKDTVIHDLRIQFNPSIPTGLTGTVTNYPNYNPAIFWMTRIELFQNGAVQDTRYPAEQFIHNQYFNSDEDRLKLNTAMGLYSSAAARNALTLAGTPLYVDLTTYFQLAHIPILFQSSELQIRVYMDTLANQLNVSTLTGSPIAPIISANLVAKITRLNPSESMSLKMSMSKSPHHYLFNEMRYGTTTVQPGNTSVNYVLSSIVGPVSYLFFTVRNTNALTGTNQYLFNQILSFSILDSSSTNMVGGQDLNSNLCMYILNKDWTVSSYSTEAANNAYAYMYSFSSDPITSANTGAHYGHHIFSGNEQLKINFSSSLSTAVQIDVYASVESILQISPNSVSKVTV